MRIRALALVVLIFVGVTAFSVASNSETNSTSLSVVSVLREYSFVFGVIGVAIGIYSFYERRTDKTRNNERNARLNKWFDDNEAYSKMSEMATTLQGDVEQLQGHKRDAEYYKKNIFPAAVRRVALKERAKTEAELVTQSYLNYKKTIDELKELPNEAEIPPSIKSDVLVYLVPEYEEHRTREARKDRVSVLSIALLIVNSVFYNLFRENMVYYPIQKFGNVFLGILLIFTLVQLIEAPFTKFVKRLIERSPEDVELQKTFQKAVKTSYIIGYMGAILFGTISILLSIIFYSAHVGRELIMVLFIFGVVAIAGGVWLYFQIQKNDKSSVKQ
jgi:hypothetical protein